MESVDSDYIAHTSLRSNAHRLLCCSIAAATAGEVSATGQGAANGGAQGGIHNAPGASCGAAPSRPYHQRSPNSREFDSDAAWANSLLKNVAIILQGFSGIFLQAGYNGISETPI